MGARKHLMAERLKKQKKNTYTAVLRNCPTSPRKMRLVVDLIRGMEANKALDILQFTNKEAALRVQKLLKSAINNFEQKSGTQAIDADLFVKEIFVDESVSLKRIQPAPQGRAYRKRKRSNHVTLVLGANNFVPVAVDNVEQETVEA
jgi:large subunit ribosomal protein L22